MLADGDGVEVAGEVQVDLVHGQHLGEAAARGAALHAQDGPSEGSRSAIITRWPGARQCVASPTVVVDLPSPAGVGDMAVTSTTLPAAAGAGTSASRDRSWPCSGRRVPGRRHRCRPRPRCPRWASEQLGGQSPGRWGWWCCQTSSSFSSWAAGIPVVFSGQRAAGKPRRIVCRHLMAAGKFVDGGLVALQGDGGGALPAGILGMDPMPRGPCRSAFRRRRRKPRGRPPSPRRWWPSTSSPRTALADGAGKAAHLRREDGGAAGLRLQRHRDRRTHCRRASPRRRPIGTSPPAPGR